MASLHNRPDAVPGFPRLPLRNPHKKECQVTEKNMRFDPFVLAMKERTKLKGRLQRPESSLHLHELFVAQGHIFRGERIVGSRKQIFAVQSLLISDFGPVDPQAPAFGLFDQPAHGPMREQRTDGLLVGFPRLLTQSLDLFLYSLESPLSRSIVFFGLFGIKHKNKPATPFSLANHDLLDLQVIFDLLRAALEGERFLMSLLAVPKFLSQDIMSSWKW